MRAGTAPTPDTIGPIVTLFVSIWTVTDLLLKLRDRINDRRDVILGLKKDGSEPLFREEALYILRDLIWEDMQILMGIVVIYGLALTALGVFFAWRGNWAGAIVLGVGVLLLGVGLPLAVRQSLYHYDQWKQIVMHLPPMSGDASATWKRFVADP